ncbi:MAG: HDIG domain-containing protein [Firmicutes bacterium]|nr:HDIG domain-containing protein [Bacillota bacterium]
MLTYRVRQFIAAVTARVSPEERAWVEQELASLQDLFFGMSVVDQRHCLDVAREALRRAGEKTNKKLLTQAALLHDCGKQAGELRLWDRVAIVLGKKIFGRRTQRWASKGRGLYHAFYIHYEHPEIGAELVRMHGSGETLCALIAGHHKAPSSGDAPEAKLLYFADQQH